MRRSPNDWGTTTMAGVAFWNLGKPRGDADDSGKIDMTDAVSILMYMFLGGSEPLPPGPNACGADPTDDGFETCVYDPNSCR
jgi:hypothetical protein